MSGHQRTLVADVQVAILLVESFTFTRGPILLVGVTSKPPFMNQAPVWAGAPSLSRQGRHQQVSQMVLRLAVQVLFRAGYIELQGERGALPG